MSGTEVRSQASWRRWYVTFEEVDGQTSKLIYLTGRIPEAHAGRKAVEMAADWGMTNATMRAVDTLRRG